MDLVFAAISMHSFCFNPPPKKRYFLLSLALPYATSVPDDVAVRVGEVIRLQCLAHGTPPLTYTWTKLDGNLPLRAEVSGGDLQINLATAEDAGSYKCVASNKVGNSEVVAKVTVRCKFAENLTKFDMLLIVISSKWELKDRHATQKRHRMT